MKTNKEFVIGIDVGTSSTRAGIFDLNGKMYGAVSLPIQLWYPAPDFVEQSSDDIWRTTGTAIRQVLRLSNIKKEWVIGISFDATCSLVALDVEDKPITVSPTGKNQQNIIVWMDHRAIDQVNRINATHHPVLKYVGSRMSPEMEPPKLLWIKEELAKTWKQAGKYLDLADFLTYRSTQVDVRSFCTTVCKWTYLGHAGAAGKWDPSFFNQVGLGELLDRETIGTKIWPMGKYIGGLTEKSARELGLLPGTAVGVGIIDAHAGGLGIIGLGLKAVQSPKSEEESLATVLLKRLEENLALIVGTSTCHMAVSRTPKFIDGIWGPYYSAMIPGMWLTEGGQSATGALLDHIIQSSSIWHTLQTEMKKRNKSVYAILNEHVDNLQKQEKRTASITAQLHVLDYFHGNRSPRADFEAKGMISGLTLGASLVSLARLYYATIQSIAYGTRHIIEAMNKKGHRIAYIHACGGGTKNPLWLKEHADITGCDIVLPQEPEAMLLGTAMLAAVAAGKYPTIPDAMSAMSKQGKVIKSNPAMKAYHDRKYRVYQTMYADQVRYREMMNVISAKSRKK